MTLKLNSAAGGSVSIDAPSGLATTNTITLPSTSGSTFLATPLTAGTTTVPPLTFTSGTNLTSATAGVMEYDGKVPYFTPQGSQRGVVPGMQYYELNSTLALSSSTSAQAWLGVGCTLSSNTVYAFQGMYATIKTTTTTSHTLSTAFGGTATLNNISYCVLRGYDSTSFTPTNNTPAAYAFIQTAASTTTMTNSAAATAYHIYNFNGVVSVNAGGTFIPQVVVSALGPIYTGQIGSYFMIYPIGTSGANVNVGTWA